MRKKFGKERRKFIRLKAHHLLKYRVVDREEVPNLLSFARNVSAGGVLFYADKEISPGNLVELEINFPEYPKPIKTVARVVRAVPLKEIGGFEMGAEFINIAESDRKFIDEKIKLAYEQKEKGGGGAMKALAITALICGAISALAAVISRFFVALPIAPMSWIGLTQTCLLFSIAFGILAIKK
ncbi:MAG: PilZ domain-containing protein [Candidatus Omnitrophota bacterium]|nr:MAG: PilZ domain-containing protein [Candidatus Omnitrophota bacterium]